MPWLWQLKLTAAQNVNKVTDTMLHAAGGSRYKADFGELSAGYDGDLRVRGERFVSALILTKGYYNLV